MQSICRFHCFNVRYLKMTSLIRKDDYISRVAQFQIIFKKCIRNIGYSNNVLNNNKTLSSVLLNHQESCDTFGNLRKSLETSTKTVHKKRIIRVKSQKIFTKREENIFGNLSDEAPIWYPDINENSKVDNEQSDDSTMVRNISRFYRDPRAYLEKMKILVKEKKLKDALDLFVDMKRNHVTPIHPQFTFMIGACGRAGYTDMAFQLLRQMTDRKMTPTPATLTGLFNSCGECPFPEYGLKKATILKEKIASKNWELNQITYHSMIKAFGRCGDIQTAFQIVDEMAEKNVQIDVDTYNFLLMSCVSDKEAGFTHAVEVWRKMKQRKCIPDEFSFNLLLRSARDCDVGPEEVSSLLLQHWSNYSSRPYGFKVKTIESVKPMLQIQNENLKVDEKFSKLNDFSDSKNDFEADFKDKTSNIENKKSLNLTNFEKTEQSLAISTHVPSILEKRSELGACVMELGSFKTSSDRLAVIGGPEIFLENMKKENVKPSIKTFTLLLECLPPYLEEEEKLISLFDIYKVEPSIGFCNVLLKRRIYRHANSAAKQVLLLISQWGVSPDVLTFGILAMGCRHYTQALHYLDDLKKLGFCPNIEIAGALVSSACTSFEFDYLQHILQLMEEENILPNEKILTKIDKTLNISKKNIINMEHGKEVHPKFKEKDFSKSYKQFCDFYDLWLHKMKIEKETNVWSQYKTDIIEKYVDEPCKIVPK